MHGTSTNHVQAVTVDRVLRRPLGSPGSDVSEAALILPIS